MRANDAKRTGLGTQAARDSFHSGDTRSHAKDKGLRGDNQSRGRGHADCSANIATHHAKRKTLKVDDMKLVSDILHKSGPYTSLLGF